MLQYAQWLDGAFLELASGKRFTVSQLWMAQTIGWLKIKALFGTNIALSDAQLNDSRVIMHLFSQPSFRRFIEKHPDSFQLIVHKNRIKEDNQFGKATTSLHASMREGWISSSFPSPNISKKFAEIILGSGEVDIERQLHPKSPFNILRSKLPSKYGGLLEGLLYAIGYFASNPKAEIHESEEEFDDMYSVLIRARDSSRIPEDQRIQLEKVISFIDRHIEDEEERRYQSKVFTTLDEVLGENHPEYFTIMHTAHHAWNSAIENTLGPETASLGFTKEKDAVQVGIYLNFPTDTFIPVEVRKEEYRPTKYGLIPLLPIECDPTKLRWEMIADIASDTVATASEFQEALKSTGRNRKHLINEAINRHVDALTYYIGPRFITSPLVPRWIWYLGEGIAFVIRRTMNIAAEIELMMPLIPFICENALQYGQYSLLTNTLRKLGKQMVTDSLPTKLAQL